MGPAMKLIQGMKKGRKECILPAASLMAYQWLQQQALLPEILIPLPLSFWQKQQHGFDVHLLLAESIGKIFKVPVCAILKRKWDRSRFWTKGEMGYTITPDQNQVGMICERRVLLVALQLSDELNRLAGKELKAFFPAQIHALAFGAFESI